MARFIKSLLLSVLLSAQAGLARYLAASYFSFSDIYFENITAMASCNLQLGAKEHEFLNLYIWFGFFGEDGFFLFLICRFL